MIVSHGKPYRTSSESVWPLRRADGRTFAAHKDGRMTHNDIFDLYAAAFGEPRGAILQPKGPGAHARRRIRVALTVSLVDHYLRSAGEHVAGRAQKVVANWLDIEQVAVQRAIDELPILKKMDPSFALIVRDIEEKIHD